MAENIIMPQLGETVAEGKIVSWFKKIGDSVAIGDRLFEVETDKVTIDVEAVATGRITSIDVGDGETVAIGTVVAVLDGQLSAKAQISEAAKPVGNVVPMVKPEAAVLVVRSPFEEVATPAGHYGKAVGAQGLRITPLARRLIAQNGLDVESVAHAVRMRNGTKIARDDVQAAMAEAAARPVVAPTAKTHAEPAVVAAGDIIPFNSIRQRTGDRLAENWRNIPHVFQAVEVDFTRVDKARSKHKDAFKAATGQSLTYLPFITRAVAIALGAFPLANARFDGKSLIRNGDINIGIAVDLAHNGLVVPVLRHADEMTVLGLACAIGRLVEKARTGKLGADDLSGGTYSISNNGAFGTLFTTPIVNAPQVAILSTDAIRMRPAVASTEAGEVIVPRMIGMVGQSFDHRAFDGAYSAAYLSHLKTILEERDWAQELA